MLLGRCDLGQKGFPLALILLDTSFQMLIGNDEPFFDDIVVIQIWQSSLMIIFRQGLTGESDAYLYEPKVGSQPIIITCARQDL